MAKKIEDVKTKLQATVKRLADWANEEGSSRLSVCNYSGWDSDEWTHRHAIMDKLRSDGFTVTSKTNHGVLDISIVKNITL